MAYFPDLTPYAYCPNPRYDEQPSGALNVGWLEKDAPYDQGPVPDGFAERLASLVRQPINRMRGYHTCPFCGRAAGNGEIHVKSLIARERTYAAPVLIAHYVATHGYRPPDEFVDAVMAQAVAERST
jgi:hypothetical protein